jgi:UrcA family protein
MRDLFKSLMFVGMSFVGTVGLVAYADPALAETPTVAVHYTSAELASVDGRDAIAKRISAAASRVCATTEAGRSMAEATCKAQAYADAEKTLGQVTADAASPVQIAVR